MFLTDLRRTLAHAGLVLDSEHEKYCYEYVKEFNLTSNEVVELLEGLNDAEAEFLIKNLNFGLLAP